MSQMDCLREVADVLNFFVRIRNYSYVDRIGNSLSIEPIEIALKDALRDLASLYGSSSIDDKGLHYIELTKGDTKRKEVLPKIPSASCIDTVLRMIREDISNARRLAIFALSWR